MTKLTPMMAQYNQIKSQYQDAILMFRLGDFYEMFFEDAIEASKILQITLTARNKGEDKTPMCGVPYHAIEGYIAKLTGAGKKVALCDQITQPDGKSIVQREVVRVITPGTTFNESILESKCNNFVACIIEGKDLHGIAYADITTGDFKTTETENFHSELERINPAEVIGEDRLIAKIKSPCKFPFSPKIDFRESLIVHFRTNSLKPFGLEQKELAIKAAATLLQYLKETQKTEVKHLSKISYYEPSDFMPLDESCIRNLELFQTALERKKEGSLLSAIDKTITSMGGRLLRNWLISPLLKKSEIENRLNAVEVFARNSDLLYKIRDLIGKIYDIERILSRLALGTGNARDLIAMKCSLKVIPELKDLLNEKIISPALSEDFEPLVHLIEKAISEESPISVREGGMIREGFNTELDKLRNLSGEGKTYIKNLQEREILRTGISSLKVRFNKVFGYYIEISKANLNFVPEDYIRKQTLVNAERFITPELKEYEEKILTAEDRIKELEYELFYHVRMEVVKEIVKIQKLAKAIAGIDVLSTFAFNAVNDNFVRPEIVDEGIEILNGRHPVIEKTGKDFVPNDCRFDEKSRFLLITGPNMGGKSTYLRQTALIVLLTQIGSFVPAEAARISLADRIFTRVGAADNLARGESTFMVEMQETAYILNHATEKSLILLDEVGRGTSTYDGVSIAWAMTEFIHDKIKAKTLFATHYHELVDLIEELPEAVNLSVAVRENEHEGVVFLYKIVEGGVDKSYGIEVAKLAGLPSEVISRSRTVLSELEKKIGYDQRDKAGLKNSMPALSPQKLFQ